MENLLRDYPVIIEIPLAWGEMDAFQHLNNVVYFRYFESARIAYFDAIEAMTVMETTGVGPILAAILFMAAAKESAGQGAMLLGLYALGIDDLARG